MNGRNQPYLDTNGAGFYEPTMWQDEVEGIQEGTPVDEQNLNNIEDGKRSQPHGRVSDRSSEASRRTD